MSLSNDPKPVQDFLQIAEDDPGDAIPFYEAEGEVLALWDKLQELKLERAILETMAKNKAPATEQTGTDEEILSQLKDAEKANLDARAQYVLRQNIVEDVLVAGPILDAIHNKDDDGVSMDRDLLALLERRDKLGIASTQQASQLRNTTKVITKVKAETIRTRQKNRDIQASLQSLDNEIEAKKEEAYKDPRFEKRLHDLRQETATSRKHWRMMKSVVSGVVAASGVEWAHDEKLRELVLDDEDEDEDEDE